MLQHQHLKAGKPASELASFRPISLTPCIVKLLERLVNNRLYYLAENNDLITNKQVGFRQGRSCKEQVIRLTHHVSDGFQCSLPKRTVMALFDYSKAYDRTWRELLLLKLYKMGVQGQLLKEVAPFLQILTAQV